MHIPSHYNNFIDTIVYCASRIADKSSFYTSKFPGKHFKSKVKYVRIQNMYRAIDKLLIEKKGQR